MPSAFNPFTIRLSDIPYLAFSLPAVLTGFLAPIVGLVLAADVYGAAVILMAIASLIAIRVARRAAVC